MNDDGLEMTRRKLELWRRQQPAGGAVTQTDVPVTDALMLKHLNEPVTRDADDWATPSENVILRTVGSPTPLQDSTHKYTHMCYVES